MQIDKCYNIVLFLDPDMTINEIAKILLYDSPEAIAWSYEHKFIFFICSVYDDLTQILLEYLERDSITFVFAPTILFQWSQKL